MDKVLVGLTAGIEGGIQSRSGKGNVINSLEQWT